MSIPGRIKEAWQAEASEDLGQPVPLGTAVLVVTLASASVLLAGLIAGGVWWLLGGGV